MIEFKLRLIALATTAFLAACGGGGGEEAAATAEDPNPATTPTTTAAVAPTAEKLAGTWSACTNTGTAKSSKEIYVSERLSDVDLAFSYRLENYPTADCSGTRTGGYDRKGTAKMQGSKTVEGLPTAKLDVNFTSFSTFGTGWSFSGSPTGKSKHVVGIQDNALRFGDSAKQIDAEGYPEHLYATAYAKQ